MGVASTGHGQQWAWPAVGVASTVCSRVPLSGSGGTLGEQYEAMKAAIAEVRIECGRAGEAAASAAGIAAESGVDVSGAEAAITRADDALRRAEDYLETEGQEALRKANEAQRKYGQQSVRMTEIAREARREAER